MSVVRSYFGARLGALFRTTTFQLTLSYSLLFGISLSLLTLFFYWSTIGLLVRETDATLKAEITSIAEQYLEHGLDRLVKVIAHRIRTDDSGNMIYVIASRDYRSLAGNLKTWPQVQPDGDGWIEFARQREDGATVTARARVYLLRDGLHLLVGRNIDQIQLLRKTFNRAMLLALGLTLVLAIGGGLFMSNRVLRRLSAFTATTAEIVEGRLDRRLETRGTGDEFDVLYDVENRALVDLEEISPAMITSLIVVEDEGFWEHNGVDAKAIGRAFIENVNAGGIEQGGSTITQQLIKNAVIGDDRELRRLRVRLGEVDLRH